MLVLRPGTRGIPETTVCRILVFMWSFWAPVLGEPCGSTKRAADCLYRFPKGSSYRAMVGEGS